MRGKSLTCRMVSFYYWVLDPSTVIDRSLFRHFRQVRDLPRIGVAEPLVAERDKSTIPTADAVGDRHVLTSQTTQSACRKDRPKHSSPGCKARARADPSRGHSLIACIRRRAMPH